MCSRRPGLREVNAACHVAYGELIRLRAENTLSTVDRGHREMISIMKAFNSSAGGGVRKPLPEKELWSSGRLQQ